MAANASTWICTILAISLISLSLCVSGDPSSASLTYNDDEDWAEPDFSGSGDGQSHEDNTITQSHASSEDDNVIDLTLPRDPVIPGKPTGKNSVKLTSDTIHLKPINSMSHSVKDWHGLSQQQKSKHRKEESPRKDKKVDKKSKRKKKLLRKTKQNGKILNLAQSKSSVTLKGENLKESKEDHHIRRNSYQNGHQDKPRKRHHNHHHKKRWRKNMDSNRHGYGSKGTSQKRKKTFEDRWPGCFSKYQSCYRDSNCCNNNCHHFTWLSFGFCL